MLEHAADLTGLDCNAWRANRREDRSQQLAGDVNRMQMYSLFPPPTENSYILHLKMATVITYNAINVALSSY